MTFVYVTVLSLNIIFRESISSIEQPLLSDQKLINTWSGIYPRTLTNVRFVEED